MLRVTVLELPARWDAAAAALAEVDRLLADGSPTDLVILPEMALTGYVSPDARFDLTRFAERLDGGTVDAARALAERHATTIVAPLVLAEAGELYNAAVVVGPDRRPVAVYRKRHPWFPERWATAGREPHPKIQVGDCVVTIAICYDGHFLEDEAVEVLSEADLLVFTSAWVDEEDSRMPLLRSLARRFGIAIANANWAAGIVEVPGQGGSCVIDPLGNVVASVSATAPFTATRIDAVIHSRNAGRTEDDCALR